MAANEHDVYLVGVKDPAYKGVQVRPAPIGLWVKEQDGSWSLHPWHVIQKVMGFSQVFRSN